MVEKFKLLLEQIEQMNGPVILYVVSRMDNFVDSWSVIISADWVSVDKEIQKSQFREILNLLVKVFTEDAVNIARVGLFTKTDYVTKQFSQFKSGTVLKEDRVNGYDIHEAHIIKSVDIDQTDTTDANENGDQMKLPT